MGWGPRETNPSQIVSGNTVSNAISLGVTTRLISADRNTMTPKDEPDEWVFDTVKAATVAPKNNTTRRRKLSVIHVNGQNAYTGAEEALRRMDLKDGPLTSSSPSPGTAKRGTVRKMPSVVQMAPLVARTGSVKKPLQPDMSFGNSGSTVRLFRRVSDNSTAGVVAASITPRDENRPPMSDCVSKEGQIGRRIYNKVVDSAFQEVHAQTSSLSQREALSNLADAWSALDAVDPEGEFQLLKLLVDKVQSDPKLASSLGLSTSQDKTPQGTPNAKPRLVMAQNNPHLRSLRRRQSSQLNPSDDQWREKIPNLPGQLVPGMEHTKQLADVLYARWADGLRNRWPQA